MQDHKHAGSVDMCVLLQPYDVAWTLSGIILHSRIFSERIGGNSCSRQMGAVDNDCLNCKHVLERMSAEQLRPHSH